MAANPSLIVVGYDGTKGARRALDAASRLMGYGSTLTVVSVARPGEAPRDVLESARDRLLEQLVAARYVGRVGEPAAEIVALARELDADVIVVGKSGADETNGDAAGSVSAAVVDRAHCDVLVVGGL